MTLTKEEQTKRLNILRAYLLEIKEGFNARLVLKKEPNSDKFTLIQYDEFMTVWREDTKSYNAMLKFIKEGFYLPLCRINKKEPKDIESEEIYNNILDAHSDNYNFSLHA